MVEAINASLSDAIVQLNLVILSIAAVWGVIKVWGLVRRAVHGPGEVRF